MSLMYLLINACIYMTVAYI